MEDLSKMKVADLKKHLRSRGLLVTGNKNELVERLQESLEADGSGTIDDDEEFDEEEILNNDISTEISQEEEAAALSGSIQIKSSDLLNSKPASEKKKVSLKRSEISISEVTKDEEKKGSAESTSLANKENLSSETVEPKHKIIKLSDDAINGSSNEEQKKPEQDPSKMTDDERKKARAERFAISMSDISSNGTSSKNAKLSTETGGFDLDKLKKRAERFGEVTSKNLSKLEDSEKKKEREKRFGTTGTTDASNGTTTEDEIALKKAKRAQRFGSSDGVAAPAAAAAAVNTSSSDSSAAVQKTSNKVPIVAPGTTATGTNDDVSAKAKRAQRFGAS